MSSKWSEQSGTQGPTKNESSSPSISSVLKSEVLAQPNSRAESHLRSTLLHATSAQTEAKTSFSVGLKLKIFDVDKNIYYAMTLFYNMASTAIQIIILLEHVSKDIC